MTQRLYYLDSYLTEFDAAIVDRTDGGKRIYLDRTAFYPASGGQPSDTGLIENVEVMDIVDEGERIAHVLKGPIAGQSVKGQVNWQRRFDHMQQHTGQHLLSAVLADQLGHTTVSVRLGEHSSTIDSDAAQLTSAQLARLEERANQLVAENRLVKVTFEEASTAIGLRKPSSRSGSIRIITIEGVDRSACGGTHVSTTGELGCILLRKTERVRKGTRLEFLCGLRAVRRSRSESEVLASLAAELSCSADELPQLIAGQRAELKELVAARRELQSALSFSQARELYSGATPDSGGIRKTLVEWKTGNGDELRALAQAYATQSQAVFVGAIESPPSVILSAGPESGINAGELLRGVLAACGGRGGGSPILAQGVVPDLAALKEVVATLTGDKTKRPA
jgi:alanyl-tRNA synthetase